MVLSVFLICKNYCNRDIKEISSAEFRELTKWLSRKRFLKFKPLSEDYIDVYFDDGSVMPAILGDTKNSNDGNIKV